MQLIKLDATTSTNAYLKQLAQEKQLHDFTVVVSGEQTQGRGQQGNTWTSEKGKNLTVSILKYFDSIKINQGFDLNCLVSLAIYEVLKELSIPDIAVKWPNDIMSGNKKLCGILIENTLKGQFIKKSIIGFGLNVNQTLFNGLPNATSMKLISGVEYDLEDVFERIVRRLRYNLVQKYTANTYLIRQEYEGVLFRKGSLSKFISTDSGEFKGTITGITSAGQLVVQNVNGGVEKYGFKEIQFVY